VRGIRQIRGDGHRPLRWMTADMHLVSDIGFDRAEGIDEGGDR
jgi:hypothetical protein